MKYSIVAQQLRKEIESSKNNNWAFTTHLHQYSPIDKTNHYYSAFDEFIDKQIVNLSKVESPLFQYQVPFEWDVPFPPPKIEKFKFIDLFAGIGGFRIALQEFGGKCVFSSEIDNWAKTTYEANFGEFPFGDIREFTGESVSDEELNYLIPDHDVLAGGFPCQPFSLAGVSARNSLGIAHGFDDLEKGNLFLDIIRIAMVKRPKVLFLENVSNFKSHDKGKTFSMAKDIIENELGYSFNWKIINSNPLVPQSRKRFYIVCFRDKREFNFPTIEGEPIPLRTILETEIDSKYTISDRLWAGHQNRTKRNLARGTGFTAHTANLDKPSNTLVARYYKDGKECLIPQDGENPRKLTPRECARLQGFPEDFKIPVSDTQAYRQFGNSVAVPVISRIAEGISEKF
jgi:DNA (cytosine-5)-methyltransferase 1